MFSRFSRFLAVLAVVALLAAMMATAAFADSFPTPVPVFSSYSDVVNGGSGILNSLGLIPVLAAGAVVGLAAVILSRIRKSAR